MMMHVRLVSTFVHLHKVIHRIIPARSALHRRPATKTAAQHDGPTKASVSDRSNAIHRECCPKNRCLFGCRQSRPRPRATKGGASATARRPASQVNRPNSKIPV